MRAMQIRAKLTTTALVAAMAAACCASAWADRQRVDETKDFKSDGFVRINVVRGELKVEAWDKSRIEVSGLLDEQTEEFIFDVNGDNAEIEVKLPGHLKSWCCSDESDLVIHVPKKSSVDISVVSTETRVNDVQGGVEVSGVSGDVTVRNARNRLDVTTVSGEVEVRDAKGRIELKSVSGDIDAYDLDGDIEMHSVSGNVLARNAGDELDLESVSGDIELSRSSYKLLTGHTISGDADVAGEMIEGGRLEFDSVSGSVRVRFDKDVDARFDLETGSGTIRNRVTSDRPVKSKYVRDETLRFVKGEGKGEVNITTRSGDIVLSPN